MRRPLAMISLLSLVLLATSGAAAQKDISLVAEPQDSVRLSRVVSAKLPSAGLLTVGLSGHRGDTVYILDDFLGRVDHTDYRLDLEASLRSWLDVWATLPWRSWSRGRDWIPVTGSGLGDGRWQVVAGRSLWGDNLYLALTGGGNIPVGDQSQGLSEGVFSPQIGAALTLVMWSQSELPELRLHLNLGRTWNRAEISGFGDQQVPFNPWPPQYQSAEAAGGTDRNDTRDLGLAVEFRAGTTSLWVEYSEQIFWRNTTVSRSEQQRLLGAGLRWGVARGWALHGQYQVSLANDDEQTSWWPGYPDIVMSLGVSRQFGWGGGRSEHQTGVPGV